MSNLALDIQNLSKTYPNGFKALKNVSIQVESGDFFALLGANGAGKSTLINTICTLTPPDQRSGIKIFGYDLFKDSFNAKRMIGVMPQEVNLAGFEKVKDILFYQASYYGMEAKVARKRVDEVLEKINLLDKKNNIALELSGGMKRRLMVARALMHNPKLLILDEPTAGVDIELRKQLWEFIVQINKDEKTTIILTTHYLEEAESLCKNLTMIHQGEVVRTGKMKTLLKQIATEYLIVSTEQNPSKDEINKIDGMQWVEDGVVKYSKEKNQSISDVCEFFKKYNLNVVDVKPDKNRLESLFFDLLKEQKNG